MLIVFRLSWFFNVKIVSFSLSFVVLILNFLWKTLIGLVRVGSFSFGENNRGKFYWIFRVDVSGE